MHIPHYEHTIYVYLEKTVEQIAYGKYGILLSLDFHSDNNGISSAAVRFHLLQILFHMPCIYFSGVSCPWSLYPLLL
jgi:hypothetical protein